MIIFIIAALCVVCLMLGRDSNRDSRPDNTPPVMERRRK